MKAFAGFEDFCFLIELVCSKSNGDSHFLLLFLGFFYIMYMMFQDDIFRLHAVCDLKMCAISLF